MTLSLLLQSLRASPHLFSQLSKVLKFTCVQEVAFGLAAVKSESQEIRKYATQFVKQKLPQLLSSYTESGSSLCSVDTQAAMKTSNTISEFVIYLCF